MESQFNGFGQDPTIEHFEWPPMPIDPAEQRIHQLMVWYMLGGCEYDWMEGRKYNVYQ